VKKENKNMKIQNYTYPKSSFLSAEKDMNIIVDRIMKNDRLKKMLYYTTRDCLDKPKLSQDETIDMFGKQIKIVPKLYVDGSVLNYMIISFDNFTPNARNPEFRDNIIEFDIICHFDQWHMKDFELRPYKIAAELDSMFNEQKLTGIGKLEFLGANQMILTDEYAGLCVMYQAIHGEEDKKDMPNPNDEEAFRANFDAIFNK
jgi:hypothetical protein